MPVGADEAGKGPVLGPMVAAAVWTADRSHLPAGVADSKALAPARRERLADRIRADDRLSVGVEVTSTERIDDPETDMNGLAVGAHAEAIEEAVAELAGDRRPANVDGVCDACDVDAARFARRVADRCGPDVSVEASHGADADDPLVGAASVVAKVERDAAVAALAARHGEVGSGYPSDPTTREFLADYVDRTGELPPFARRSWKTCRELLTDHAQAGLDAYADR